MAVANYAVETDEYLTDDERDAVASELALTQKQAEDVIRPLAKAIAPTGLNKKYGRQVVENVDAISAVAELVTLGLHWRRYFKDRAIREGRRPGGPVIDVEPVIAMPPDGSLPPPAGPGPGGTAVEGRAPRRGEAQRTTAPPREGVVVSAEMIAEMRGRRVAS
jgi:hypothetical protein